MSWSGYTCGCHEDYNQQKTKLVKTNKNQPNKNMKANDFVNLENEIKKNKMEEKSLGVVCVMVKIMSYILPDVALMDVFIETESLLSNNSVIQFIY